MKCRQLASSEAVVYCGGTREKRWKETTVFGQVILNRQTAASGDFCIPECTVTARDLCSCTTWGETVSMVTAWVFTISFLWSKREDFALCYILRAANDS